MQGHGRKQKLVEGGAKMPFCKFHGSVGVKTFFLEINNLRATSGAYLLPFTAQ